MKRWILSVLVLGACTAATAAFAAPGLNFYWDACPATGVTDKTFACDDDFAQFDAFGTFIAPAGVDSMGGADIVIDVLTEGGALPAWWDLFNAGSCRPGAISMSFIRPSGCAVVNYWRGQAAGGVAAYRNNTTPGAPTPAPNRARITGSVGIAENFVIPIATDAHVFAFGLSITGDNTTGGTACAGCATKVCLVLNQITIGLVSGNEIPVTDAATNRTITFQGAGPDCSAAPTKNRTWGAVKALYR